MNRVSFSLNIANLIVHMNLDGLHPAIDYVKRSTEEQQRMFEKGASKLDGVHKLSAHQSGMAADILLFTDDGKLMTEWPKEISEKYHQTWVLWGGKPVITWDVGHFEA